MSIIEYTYIHIDNTAYYTPRLYGTAYYSQATSLYSILLYQMLLATVTQLKVFVYINVPKYGESTVKYSYKR